MKKDAQQVMSIFTNRSESEDASVAYRENGLLIRISNIMTSYDDRTETALDTIEESLRKLTDKIDTMEDKMYELEERYYKKFCRNGNRNVQASGAEQLAFKPIIIHKKVISPRSNEGVILCSL